MPKQLNKGNRFGINETKMSDFELFLGDFDLTFAFLTFFDHRNDPKILQGTPNIPSKS